jgi:hypothetical protein
MTTAGRGFLHTTVKSFEKQALEPEDRLFILGDGWDRWAGMDDPRVVFIPRSKVGMFGHDHIHWLINSDLFTPDYFVRIDDDDVFLPWAFKTIRPLLDREVMWCTSSVNEEGKLLTYQFHWPKVKIKMTDGEFREAHIAGLQPFIPNRPPFEWKLRRQDGHFFREQAERFTLGLLPIPLMMKWAAGASEEVWGMFHLDTYTPWKDWQFERGKYVVGL